MKKVLTFSALLSGLTVSALSVLSLGTPAMAQLQAPEEKAAMGARMPALSPDGKKLAFVYRGDVWVSDATGGHAYPVTDHVEYDAYPLFSPDGKWIAFSSLRNGNWDIFVVPAAGGAARQMTFASSSEIATDWSPDGKTILFASQYDVPNSTLFALDVDTLRFHKLTEDYKPLAGATYAPDGKAVVFQRHGFPWTRPRYHGSAAAQIWTLNLQNNQRTQITTDDQQHLWPHFVLKDGSFVAVTVGAPTPNAQWLDKPLPLLADTEALTPNLWYFPSGGGKPHQLTHFVGDGVRCPAVARDSNDITFEYDHDLWRLPFSLPMGTKKPEKITLYCGAEDKQNNVSREVLTTGVEEAEVSPDGKTFAFAVKGDLWTIPTEKAKTRNADDATRLTDYPGFDRDFIWATDNKTIFFVSDRKFNNRVYAMNVATQEVRPVWTGNEDASSPKVSPDGKMLAFWVAGPVDGQGGGKGGLYTAALTPDQKDYSPRRLLALPSAVQGEFSWSPDMRWLAYTRRGVESDGYNIWIMPADGSGKAVNVTKLNAIHSQPTWSPDGKYLYFSSTREGAGLYVLPLQPEAARADELEFSSDQPRNRRPDNLPFIRPNQPNPSPDPNQPNPSPNPNDPNDPNRPRRRRFRPLQNDPDIQAGLTIPDDNQDADDNDTAQDTPPETPKETPKDAPKDAPKDDKDTTDKKDVKEPATKPTPTPTPPPRVEINFEDTEQRIRRISTQPVQGDLRIAEDGQLVFISAGDIWSVSPDGKDLKNLTNSTGVTALRTVPGNRRMYFVRNGGLYQLLAVGPINAAAPITFSAVWQHDVRAEQKAAFTEFWRTYNTSFYDGNFHGRNWAAIRDRYEPLLDAVGTRDEFAVLLNRMIGELEASHSEVNSGPSAVAGPATRSLGVYFDYSYQGPGLRVKDVPKRSPGAYEKTRIKPGEYIMAVDGKDVTLDENLFKVLNDKGDKDFELLVNSTPTRKDARTVKFKALSGEDWSDIHYRNRIDRSRRIVAAKSNDKVAYVHIQGMGLTNEITFDRELYEYAEGKDAVIIDVRFNGGGNIADTLINWLGTRPYGITMPRDGYPQPAPDRGWHKPIVVLMNELSMSNAEMFPYGMRAHGIAKLVGMPTPGYVIWTRSFPLVNGTQARMPGAGVYRLDGSPMEDMGEQPDVRVPMSTEDWLAERDPQLEAAVDLLMKK